MEPICDEFLRGVIEAGERDVAVRLLKAREIIIRFARAERVGVSAKSVKAPTYAHMSLTGGLNGI